MKLLLSAIALGLAAVSPALLRAQDTASPAPSPDAKAAPEAAPGGRRGNPKQMLQMMRERLNLTDDQVAKVRAIMKDVQDKRTALRDDDSLSREDRRAKFMELQKSSHDQIRGMLTPDQQKIFDAMPARPPRGNGKPSGESAPPPPANNT